MSEHDSKMGFDPIVEFQAQETGVDPEKISEFMAILEDETTKMTKRVMARGLLTGLNMDQCVDLMVNVSKTLGMPEEAVALVNMKKEDGE